MFSGTRAGRRDAYEITVYKAMGHAVEDLVAAEIVLRRAGQADAVTVNL